MKKIYKAQSINLYEYNKKLWFKHYLIARWKDLGLLVRVLVILLFCLAIAFLAVVAPVVLITLLFAI